MNGPFSIEAALARGDITPKPGIRLTGYAVRIGESCAVDEPLLLTVLALRDTEGRTALVIGIDLCIVDVPNATELREACAVAAGTTADYVLVNINHTHSAPAIGVYTDCYPPEQRELHREYWANLLSVAKTTSRDAAAALRPARFSFGWGECRGNINRRQKSDDGNIVLGENPGGACDSSVGVIRFDHPDGSPLAVVFRYSCHPVTLGPRTNRISPDYPGPARRLVESVLGCPGLFLQGCAGNINPATGIGQDDETSPLVLDDKTRLGQRLGAAVVEVAQSINTARRRKEPVFVESVGRYWLYEYTDITEAEPAFIKVRTETSTLPLTPFPAIAEIQAERESWAQKLRDAQDAGKTTWETGPLLRFLHWADLRLTAARTGPNPAVISFPLQDLRVGPIRFCAIPFEAMTESGLALQETHGPGMFALGFSNGIVSYLPTAEISREGGMEAKLGYKSYLIPSEIPGDWACHIRKFFL